MPKSELVLISPVVNADRIQRASHVTTRQVLKVGHINCCPKVPIYLTVKGAQSAGTSLISFLDFSS